MEVRDQGVHGAEAEAGDDHEIGLAVARRRPGRARRSADFEDAGRRGADGDDAPARRARARATAAAVSSGGRSGSGSTRCSRDVVDLDRPEGPGADVEHDLGALDAARRAGARAARR